MKVRPIAKGHITMCPYCKAIGAKTQAKWHLTGANKQACDAHISVLDSLMQEAEQLNKQDYSEADHQSWMCL